MHFDVLTLFPNLVLPYFEDSILKRAQDSGALTVQVHNIRDFSTNKHHSVDDTPYGGGAGMLMTCQPLFDAIRKIKETNKGPVIFFTPQGERFNQTKATELAKLDEAILLCGRYEGIDQRVRDELVDMEISMGDFVLTGGELPALTLVDAVTRLLPGVLGHEDSAHDDSLSGGMAGMLEYPHYTKPADFEGHKVPDVLLSGDHGAIAAWRKDNRKKPR